MSRVVRRCGCGREYDAAAWRELPYGWHEHIEADEDGPAVTVEYRHCPCTSTIAVDVAELDAPKPEPLRLAKADALRALKALQEDAEERQRRPFAGDLRLTAARGLECRDTRRTGS